MKVGYTVDTNNRDTINRLADLRQQLQNKRDKVKSRLEEVEKQLESVTVTLHLFQEEQGAEAADGLEDMAAVEEIRGLTQLEALVVLARRNGGKVKIMHARPKLIRAKVMKPGKNTYNILYTVLTRSGRFKHAGPGEYELIEDKPEKARLAVVRASG